jgi:hypothetical protein
MGLLRAIHQGNCGVRFPLPNGVEVVADEERSATVHDRDRAVVLFFHRFDERLDLRHPQLLRQDIERHARDVFETCFRLEPPEPIPGNPVPAAGPRTHDASWSPVTSVTPVRVGNADALTVIHRLWYHPGRESIIGHLLIPLSAGLFEIRVVAKQASMTGLRESTLMARALRGAPDEPEQSVLHRMSQAEMDDPRHDVEFPDHPLSSTRRVLQWLVEKAGIEVLDPQGSLPEGEVEVPRAGIAITPPPRYLLMEQTGTATARWSRVCFSGTDGVQHLTVAKLAGSLTPADPRGLRARAEELLRARIPEGVTDLQMKSSARPEYGGRLHAESFRSYVKAGYRYHAIFRWVAEHETDAAMVGVETSQCVPIEELKAAAEAVVDSLRFLEDRAAPEPPPVRSLRRRP